MLVLLIIYIIAVIVGAIIAKYKEYKISEKHKSFMWAIGAYLMLVVVWPQMPDIDRLLVVMAWVLSDYLNSVKWGDGR